MRVAITGADGFIGKHLVMRLHERRGYSIACITRTTSAEARRTFWKDVDIVVHLAGVNRPSNASEFEDSNVGFTKTIVGELQSTGRRVPIIFSSSTQAALDTPYGRSKSNAEDILRKYGLESGASVSILRLPNVFGKWARPNYNSAVATFCYNIARGESIYIHNAEAPLHLVYIDDVIDSIETLLSDSCRGEREVVVERVHETTVGAVAETIRMFSKGRYTRKFGAVGEGLLRALYATYVSYLPTSSFSYKLQLHSDARGSFTEVLRTPNAGQFSFFTAHPGVTRGGHYHHTKTEKFLVVHGKARFRFQQVVTGERIQIIVEGHEARVVETVPGWAHDITNIGEDQLIVLLWANEAFDPSRPDTIPAVL